MLERENRALRARLSRLSAASLRINESLELEAVLQGVLDSARSLTGARYGVMTLLDDAKQIRDFLSSGMTADEAQRIWTTPDGMRIFEYLGSLSAPLRIPDLLGHLGAMDLPEFLPPESVDQVLSFLAAPVLHRGEHVGHIFVADRESGDEFLLEDEETLVMFASHAALVIANARRHRDELRARGDLEILIDTSPVGVVVFDARTGSPVSFNRESRRLVDVLRNPGQSPEQLLEVVTVRRADGREVPLDQLPLVRVLAAAETVRAEEIVMQVPDGRSVRVLVNATPIHAEGSEVESFVVTLQDMSPLEDQERLRAEFLAMVSHELRMPLTSIKGSAATVLNSPASLGRAEIVQFFRIIDSQADRMHDLIGSLLDVARIETGTLAVEPKPTDVKGIVEEAKQAFSSTGGRHGVEIDLPADLPWVVADGGRIAHVLGNLLANAARHSPDGSPIRVGAGRKDVHVAISVSDEGRGVPADLLPHLFRKFSGTDSWDSGSGGGPPSLGLAICKGIVEAHGGRIWAESDGPGLGTRFTFTLPAVEEGAPGEIPPPVLHPLPASAKEEPVLAVGDDPQTLRYIRDALNTAGYSPIVTGDPGQAQRLLEERRPRLVLMDLSPPDSDGIGLMHTFLETSDVPIILLSVYGDEDMGARAMELGAADYVVKPFSPTELSARVRAALRGRAASGWPAPPSPFTTGDLRIDYTERRVTVGGRPVQLTATEYEVLHRLSTAPGRLLTHDQLLQRVWGRSRKGEPWLVRNVVKRLRRKLGDDASDPAYIITEPRVGYRIAKDEGPASSRP